MTPGGQLRFIICCSFYRTVLLTNVLDRASALVHFDR